MKMNVDYLDYDEEYERFYQLINAYSVSRTVSEMYAEWHVVDWDDCSEWTPYCVCMRELTRSAYTIYNPNTHKALYPVSYPCLLRFKSDQIMTEALAVRDAAKINQILVTQKDNRNINFSNYISGKNTIKAWHELGVFKNDRKMSEASVYSMAMDQFIWHPLIFYNFDVACSHDEVFRQIILHDVIPWYRERRKFAYHRDSGLEKIPPHFNC